MSESREDRAEAEVNRRRESRRIEAYRAVLATKHGRLVFDDLLSKFGVYRSIWHPSALIHYNAGKQDAAHQILADLVRADEELTDVMSREARERRKTDEQELNTALAKAREQ